VRSPLLPVPAAVTVRSHRVDWSPTLGLSYAAVIHDDVPLRGERDQLPKWFDLNDKWESVFPEDHGRIRAYASRLAAGTRSEGTENCCQRRIT
jgi:8-oxo-dGTP diphosphatase